MTPERFTHGPGECPECGLYTDAHQIAYGTQIECPKRLRAEVDALAARVRGLEGFVREARSVAVRLLRHIDHEDVRVNDHACARCVPGGEMVIDGFVCDQHQAEDWARALLAGDGRATEPETGGGT
jgi:ribosomal protein S27AE